MFKVLCWLFRAHICYASKSPVWISFWHLWLSRRLWLFLGILLRCRLSLLINFYWWSRIKWIKFSNWINFSNNVKVTICNLRFKELIWAVGVKNFVDKFITGRMTNFSRHWLYVRLGIIVLNRGFNCFWVLWLELGLIALWRQFCFVSIKNAI